MKKAYFILLFFSFIIFSGLADTITKVAEIPVKDTIPKYEKGNKRNPFIPIVANDGQLINIQDEDENSSLNLEGIIYDENGQSMAIVNGQILRKNDAIGDAKIIEIRKDSVVYIKAGEIFILNVKGKEE